LQSEVARPLARLVEDELSQPETSPAVVALCAAVRARYGPELAAVLFYGSCLRKNTSEGVLDFYVLVDSYRAAYGPGLMALGNKLLPPNVFYLEAAYELPGGGTETVRCKYALISLADFEHSVSAACLHSYIWARFAQPARLVYVRDAEACGAVIASVSEAVVTLVRQLGVFLPATGRIQRFSLAALWNEAFQRTYGAELRPESAESTRDLFGADHERYELAGMAALETLATRGWLEAVTPRASAVEVEMPTARRSWLRWRWHLTRPLAKILAFLRLLKTATTFGDWLPYALWKLERHSGAQVELSERQRRHPLIFGWPVIFGLIRRRSLR
jgi:hypothetical protein